MKHVNPFRLLKERRFAPLFFTQTLGAWNDNMYKQACVVFFSLMVERGDINHFFGRDISTIAAGLIILPFFLFSSLAGQLADKYDKAYVMRLTKVWEFIIMCLATLSFYLQSPTMMLSIVFLMGTQSTFFGPAKYSILPQALPTKQELVRGNALIEMGTFVGILAGGICGALLISKSSGSLYAGIAVIFIALFGMVASYFIPSAPSSGSDIKINWNLFSESIRIVKLSHKNPVVFLSILGISWFWFYGGVFVAQATFYNIEFLGGDKSYATAIIFGVFSIGIGTGSILCERLCNNKIELGLVPLGAIGMSIFAIDISFAHGVKPDHILTVKEFISSPTNIHVLLDMFLIGMFGGFYTIPLYTIMQNRSHPNHRSRVIAANNIINSIFMVASSLMSLAILQFVEIPQLFFLIGIMNAIVTVYIYFLTPEFLLRFLAWMLIHSFYRLEHDNLEVIPEKGAVVVVSNHVSYVDTLVLLAASPRPIKFVMDHNWYNVPVLKHVFKTMGAIPIASAKEDPDVKDRAFDIISQCLDNGELVCIFPEGMITKTGEINIFRNGVAQILQRNPVPVIPVALQGLWGSFFSRKYGKAMAHFPRTFFSKIGIKAGNSMPAETKLEEMEAAVKELRGDWA